jgi:methylenetetrahydrofolate dehydrogenase (NADP+)/methenyltetrahydrofolate cyclohydrolase
MHEDVRIDEHQHVSCRTGSSAVSRVGRAVPLGDDDYLLGRLVGRGYRIATSRERVRLVRRGNDCGERRHGGKCRRRWSSVGVVTAILIEGAPLAERIRVEVSSAMGELGTIGLATVLVGDDAASQVYVGHKHKAAIAAGMASYDHRLPGDTPSDELFALLDELNADDRVDGILVQLPVPDHIEGARILRAIDPIKDVDGFHPFSAGQLYMGHPTFVPATPAGVMALLDEYGVELEGANAVVLGRSQIVGKPMAHLLLGRNATVTVCHSRTRNLAEEARRADLLVVGIGRAQLVTADMVKEGAAVVDVGITRTESGLVGDVHPDVADVAGLLTPVPGGVGPMTIAMLLQNTVTAARYRRGLLPFP